MRPKGEACQIINLTPSVNFSRSTSCKYRFPVEFPDDLVACSRIPVDLIEKDRFTMQYMVWSKTHERVAAEGDGTIVMYDYQSGKKSIVSEALKACIGRIEGEIGIQ